MRLLFDTRLLLWAAGMPDKLPSAARSLVEAPENEIVFSVASIWEVAIKRGLGRADFTVDSRLLRRGLLEVGYRELAVAGSHAVAVDALAPIHRDPFDRMLIAQALVEEITLVTADPIIARYQGPIRLV